MLEASYEALQHIASPWGMVALISGTMIGMLSGDWLAETVWSIL